MLRSAAFWSAELAPSRAHVISGSQSGPSWSCSPFMSTKHWRKNRSRLPAVGLARKLISVSVNSGDGRRRHRPNVSTRTSPRSFSLCAMANRAADGAAEQVTNQVGRRRAGLFDELAQPREHTVCVEWRLAQQRGSVTRKVGDDHAIGLHKLRDHPKPGEGELPWTVQQDDRRAVTPDEHRGRDTSQHQPTLRDRGRVQQLLTGAVAASSGSLFSTSGSLIVMTSQGNLPAPTLGRGWTSAHPKECPLVETGVGGFV